MQPRRLELGLVEPPHRRSLLVGVARGARQLRRRLLLRRRRPGRRRLGLLLGAAQLRLGVAPRRVGLRRGVVHAKLAGTGHRSSPHRGGRLVGGAETGPGTTQDMLVMRGSRKRRD